MKYFFLGWIAEYEQVMIKNLSLRHKIETISTPKITKRLNRYISKINKLFNKNLISNEWLARNLLSSYSVSNSDILICNDWQFKRDFQPTIIKNFKGKKVLLVRNLIDLDFMLSIKGVFDKVYSFDKPQCELYGMDYLNQFFPYGVDDVKSLHSRIEESTGAPKCFFLGRDKGRTAAIKSIAKQLRGLCCVADFYIVKDKNTKYFSEYHVDEGFSYDKSIEMSTSSNFLLDIPQDGQAGITLRALESIFFNKKLITSNNEIKLQPFFRPENIHIIGKDNFNDLCEFIQSKSTVLPEEILHQFSPDHMLKKITADMK